MLCKLHVTTKFQSFNTHTNNYNNNLILKNVFTIIIECNIFGTNTFYSYNSHVLQNMS